MSKKTFSIIESVNVTMFSFRMIKIAKTFSEEFICSFDLSYYPFYTQECDLKFKMKGNTKEFVNLIKGYSTYKGPIQFSTYSIKAPTFTSKVMLFNLFLHLTS